MYFSDIINAAISKDTDRPLMQKELYPVSEPLQHYLERYKRDIPLPVNYADLFHYSHTNSIKDAFGKPTHWENVVYEKKWLAELKPKLLAVYSLLNQAESIVAENLEIKAIDFCEYANSMPFRITIIDTQKDQADFFYIKSADASRIYGLELEQMLSPNQSNFLYHQQTLAEAHIDGIPGDVFLLQAGDMSIDEQQLLAEEFVRFNERCFTRLLGDMRSYNFVVIKNKTDEGVNFRIKAIDFDQQCYEGRMNLYLPQFYKENIEYVQMSLGLLNNELIEDIQLSESKKMAGLAIKNSRRLSELLQVMSKEEISENYKIVSLKKELGNCFHTYRYSKCKTMGCLVKQQLKQMLHRHLKAQ
jgi:hypothetical protein